MVLLCGTDPGAVRPSLIAAWWHPSSWTGPSEHLLRAGEHVTEELSLGGRHVRIQWIVRESSPPRRWVIGGRSEDGGTATITYTLLPESQGTRFKREFVYNIPVLFGELGDFLSLQSRLQVESAESLRRLKRILETEAIKDGSRHDLRWDATPDNPSSDRTSAIPATTAHVPSKTTNGMKSIRYEE
jgi:hypothetical protein